MHQRETFTECKYFCFFFVLTILLFKVNYLRKELSKCLTMQGNFRQSWILDSTPRIPDFRLWIPAPDSGTWILDSNRQ